MIVAVGLDMMQDRHECLLIPTLEPNAADDDINPEAMETKQQDCRPRVTLDPTITKYEIKTHVKAI